MEVSGELYAPAASSPGEELPIPVFRRLGEHQSRSGQGGEEKYSPALPVIEPRSSGP
jgi:hypothetical protein